MRPLTFLFAVVIASVAGPALGQPAAPQSARPTLALTNKSGTVIDELYVSSTRSTGWGEDRLGDGRIVRNGTFRLRLADGCMYDLQVVYDDKRTEERMRVNLCRTPAQTFTASEAHAVPVIPSHDFALDNHSTRTIVGLSLAESTDTAGEEDWGSNLLSASLPPGQQARATRTGDCQVAVRVLFDNGSAEQRHAVDVCTGDKVVTVAAGWTTADDLGEPGAPPADPAQLLTVTNRGPARMTELFLYPDGGPKGDERLGVHVLEPGAEMQIALQRDGVCLFTARGVFAGNVPDQVRTGIDFCPRRTVEMGAATP